MIYINEIMKLPINQKYTIMEGALDNVEFSKIENEYTWCINHTRPLWPSTFPMKNNTYILTFKTLIGAKRNFIRWAQKYYKKLLIYGNALQRLKNRYETKNQ